MVEFDLKIVLPNWSIRGGWIIGAPRMLRVRRGIDDQIMKPR